MIDLENGFDLGPYLRRIGYEKSTSPSLVFLRELLSCHTSSIPFENLDTFLHKPVSLDLDALEQKILHSRRGGYCYEQNLLLAHALGEIGFEVSGLAARVRWNKDDSDLTPRTHMLLKVKVEGRAMICDVGFGAMTLTGPLELVPFQQQETSHETYRLMPNNEGYQLEAKVRDEWKPLYAFGLEEHLRCDFEVPNFYLSTREGSHFRNTLMAARPSNEVRYALSNNRFTVRTKGGGVEQTELSTADEIAGILDSKFLIAIPDRDDFEQALRREGIV